MKLRDVIDAVRTFHRVSRPIFPLRKRICACKCEMSDHIELRRTMARRKNLRERGLSGRDCIGCACPGYSPRWADVLFGRQRRFAKREIGGARGQT